MSRLDDGFSTLITFSLATPAFYEKSVTPPSIEAGGENDTTTMRNTTWRTKAPKLLKTLGECSGTAAYDPVVYNDIVTMIGQNQLITITFSDGASLAFWGWLDAFTPGESVEGEQPTADFTIICSNQNDSGVETAPVYTAAA